MVITSIMIIITTIMAMVAMPTTITTASDRHGPTRRA
jgi:hypothetical protein